MTVVRWRTMRVTLRLAGAWSKPAIEFPYLVAVRTDGARQRMVGIDLRTGRQRVLDVLTTGDDLGRPSIDRGQVTWHKTTPTSLPAPHRQRPQRPRQSCSSCRGRSC